MSPFSAALLAGLGVSSLALIGFASLLIAEKRLSRILHAVVPFAAGSLLGAAFFHLLPESVEEGGATFELALLGMLIFFVLDSLLWIYHCHGGHRLHTEGHHGHASCPTKPVGVLNLVGDALHNIADGVVIGSAFLVGIPFGIVTTIAVALHEVPQEVSDFGILLHSGFKPRKALIWNGLIALTILIGIVGVFIAGEYIENLTQYALPLAAGGFIYIAASNLLPEIKEESSIRLRALQFVFLLVGIAVLASTKFLIEE